MKLYLIRHGATDGNSQRRYIGKRTDESLSLKGRNSILENLRNGKYPEADMVFVSPLKRCLETAALIFPEAELNVIEDFCEMDFGEFENRNYEELKSCQAYKNWLREGGTGAFPGGESREEFVNRVRRGFELMSKSIKKAPVTVAAVVHGGTIMALCSSLGKGSYFDFQVKNGEVVELEL